MMQPEYITLGALNQQIKNAVQESFSQAVWVIAEILEMQVNRSGHCYLELVEKGGAGNSITARSRATIWAFKFAMIRSYFETASGTKLEPGIKVLVRAEVSFHEIYGLSLNIVDIEPSFTLGDLALRKKEVLKKLEEAGVLKMNKELVLSEIPRRIAVISSETAAGLGDFTDSLLHNPYNFGFSLSLFPAIVQGEAAEQSIIAALERVYVLEGKFDAVVLIRGGGSQADLECFNGYELAMNIAQFPVPVLTGIGHERDETIADIVAHKSLKTPTAVAEFLVDRLNLFAEKLARFQERFNQSVRWILQQESVKLIQHGSNLKGLVRQSLQAENHRLRETKSRSIRAVAMLTNGAGANLINYRNRLIYSGKGLAGHWYRDMKDLRERLGHLCLTIVQRAKLDLANHERNLELVRPEKVLSRGYSITSIEGKAVKSVKQVNKGSRIETRLADGTLLSEVEKINELKPT